MNNEKLTNAQKKQIQAYIQQHGLVEFNGLYMSKQGVKLAKGKSWKHTFTVHLSRKSVEVLVYFGDLNFAYEEQTKAIETALDELIREYLGAAHTFEEACI